MGSRVGWVVVAVSLLSSTAWAQEGLRSASLPERTPQQPIPMAPSQPGVRSGSLPDRHPQNPIPPARVDQFIAHPRTYTPRLPGEPVRRQRGLGIPVGGYGYYSNDVATQRDEMPQTIPTGYLYLQLQPGTAQVFVDGLYTGTVDDYRRVIPGRAIDAGAHRVELRAAGYETAAFDVLIQPNDTTAYRTDLRATPVRTAAAAGAAKTFYVIPGCYAGDKPPAAATLRKGCDRSKVRVIPPTVSTAAHNR